VPTFETPSFHADWLTEEVAGSFGDLCYGDIFDDVGKAKKWRRFHAQTAQTHRTKRSWAGFNTHNALARHPCTEYAAMLCVGIQYLE
jgi:hypothetical protein